MEAILHSPYGSTVLGMGTVSIGTTPDNQLVLSDASVGAHHAEIRPEGQGHSIIDLGTSAGTLVNGQRLYPQVPQVLQNGDTVGLGSTQLTYEAKSSSSVPPTVYASPGSSSVPPTIYGSSDLSSSSSYSLSPSATPPPPTASSSTAPPPPTSNYSIDPYGSSAPKKKSRRGLWITLSVVGVLLVVIIVFLSLGSRGPSTTPTQTFQAYCTALKAKDAHTAHGFFASSVQNQVTEASLKQEATITNSCDVSGVDDNAGTGVITYTLTSGGKLVEDDKVVQEDNSWKINYQKVRSSPALTLIQYCNALMQGDFQAAYKQLSSSAQSNTSESQFEGLFSGGKPSNCTISSVDDAGKGVVTMTFNGSPTSFDETLINEKATWKINDEEQHSTPTLTLNNYCSALKQGDFQTAYKQFSSAYQSQQSQQQFAASFPDGKPSDCTVGKVDDTAGTGVVTMTINGSTGSFNETLVNENGTWKIKSEEQQK